MLSIFCVKDIALNNINKKYKSYSEYLILISVNSGVLEKFWYTRYRVFNF